MDILYLGFSKKLLPLGSLPFYALIRIHNYAGFKQKHPDIGLPHFQGNSSSSYLFTFHFHT